MLVSTFASLMSLSSVALLLSFVLSLFVSLSLSSTSSSCKLSLMSFASVRKPNKSSRAPVGAVCD